MIIPPYIKPGDKIRIVSPAGKIKKEHVYPAVEWLIQKGYKVDLGKHVFKEYFQFAGTDRERLEDLQNSFDDPETKAIIFSRGGYGTIRIIDHIDFTEFKKHPKWLVGFSDISVLHAAIYKMGFATIHGVMPRYFFDGEKNPNENLISLMEILEGREASYQFKSQNYNKQGIAKSEIVGGNLSIICSLLGTKYELHTNGKILFIEDIDEYLYHTDRMMFQLKLSGKLDNLAGLLVGDFTDMKDNQSPFGLSVEEIILDAVKEFDYPVCFGFPSGHDKKNLALLLGKVWELKVMSGTCELNLT